ncbi:MAG: folate-binding protein YgfZ [Variibacter sp.]
MRIALLSDRGVVKVAGETARDFLNGLVTSDMTKVAPDAPRFAALLTPQGKIIADFIVVEASEEDGGGFFLDCPRALAHTLFTRLTMYKLRAKIAIEDLSDSLSVLAIWDGSGETEYGLVYPDPRLPALGHRAIVPADHAKDAAAEFGAPLGDLETYEAHRIALAVPRGGADFAYNDVFPHEADMDQLGGVDFDKGCYVGQEVVSRMQHRGTARTRIVAVTFADFAPECGVPVLSGEKTIGIMGSAIRGRGIAKLRIDRVADGIEAGAPLTAGGVPITPVKPGWARFDVPPAMQSAS